MYRNAVMLELCGSPFQHPYPRGTRLHKQTGSRIHVRDDDTAKGITFCRHPEFISGSSKMGFTLIELLVVVLIIGILAAVALPQYQKAVNKSRAVQAITLVKSVRDAAEVYYLAHGVYPSSLNDIDVGVPPVKDCSWAEAREWKDGRFSLKHTKKPVYFIIASGNMRVSRSLNVTPLRGKIYCWSNSMDGIEVCRSVGKQKLEGVNFRGEFWEI